MSKLVSTITSGLWSFLNKSLVKNMIIITLCAILVYVQLFFPYNYYASAQRNPNSTFQVGIHYVYEQDNLDQIYGQVGRIHDLGFKVIRISMECNPLDDSDLLNQKTDMFFSATDVYGLAVSVVVANDATTATLNYYLDHWGNKLAYIQVLNEPETSSSWDVGALYTDNEVVSNFETLYSTIQSYHLSVQLYTNFGIGYILRTNIPVDISKNLNFVGLDVYMDSFLVMSPHFVQNLHDITEKDVVITEFGMSTSDSTAKTDFLLKGLNLFKSMGLKGCWIVYWNSEFDNYGIRDTPTEKAVGDWIAQNAK